MVRSLYEILDDGNVSEDDYEVLSNWAPATIVAHPEKYLSKGLAESVEYTVASHGPSRVIRLIREFRLKIGHPHVIRRTRRNPRHGKRKIGKFGLGLPLLAIGFGYLLLRSR